MSNETDYSPKPYIIHALADLLAVSDEEGRKNIADSVAAFDQKSATDIVGHAFLDANRKIIEAMREAMPDDSTVPEGQMTIAAALLLLHNAVLVSTHAAARHDSPHVRIMATQVAMDAVMLGSISAERFCGNQIERLQAIIDKEMRGLFGEPTH